MGNRSLNILYGTVVLTRSYCKNCATEAFLIDNRLQCCDAPLFNKKSKKVKRISEALSRRSRPSVEKQREIVANQGGRCFYCDRDFGAVILKRGKEITLKIEWDHLSPYSYQKDNSTANFVAACHICNRIKSNLMFQTIEEAQIYILHKWEEKGYEI